MIRRTTTLLLLTGAAVGATESAAQVPDASPVANAPSAAITAITDAAWLAGCWRMDDGRREMDEQWMAPAGNAMLGMNRSLRDGEFRGYELLILKPDSGRLIYEAHPSGQAPAQFASSHVSDSLLVFENPAHDFPQKLEYHRSGADSILARVFGSVDDPEPAFEVPLGRIACAGTALPSPAGPTALEMRGPANYITAYPAMPREGVANAVIEIPAGTDAKWEVVEPGSTLAWEIEDGLPRVVRYLAYPANYGMIPRTRLPKERGGDGDPLDVIVLGPALPRGAVITVRPVGVLHLLEDGERDDKILAVRTAGPLSDVTTLAGLERMYPGLTEIVRIWFTSYKGPGRLESSGFGDEVAAVGVVREASEMYEASTDDEREGH